MKQTNFFTDTLDSYKVKCKIEQEVERRARKQIKDDAAYGSEFMGRLLTKDQIREQVVQDFRERGILG